MQSLKKLVEKRISKRYKASDDLQVKIVFSSENPGFLGRNIPTKSVDLSKEGFRLELCKKPVNNSVIDFQVTFKNDIRIYNLTGNVRWIKPAEKPENFDVGIVLRLRTDEVCDLAEWQKDYRDFVVC